MVTKRSTKHGYTSSLTGRYVLSYNISPTETAAAVVETFERAFEVEPDACPMIYTDRGSAYCSKMFNDYLAERNCVHSMSHPGHPWENSPIERCWNDFKLIWLEKHPRLKTLENKTDTRGCRTGEDSKK